MNQPRSILLLTKGHPFEKGPFFDWIDGIPNAEVTHMEHPAAEAFIAAGLGDDYDLWLHYDMPGYEFGVEGGVRFYEPSQAFKTAYRDRLERQGLPCLYLHHALAAWPTWQRYGEIVGGRFLYRPGDVRGKACLDSGYRHDVCYKVQVELHPITKGVPNGFEVIDELYLAEMFEDDVVPLLRSNHDFAAQHFYSASQAVDGKMFSNKSWDHPAGSNLIGWIKHFGHAPQGYLQMGDTPKAYNNMHVTALLHNMVEWLMSDEAKAWAMNRRNNDRNH